MVWWGAHPRRADDLAQVEVHPVVALLQVAVVRLAALQLHQLRRGGRRIVRRGEKQRGAPSDREPERAAGGSRTIGWPIAARNNERGSIATLCDERWLPVQAGPVQARGLEGAGKRSSPPLAFPDLLIL